MTTCRACRKTRQTILSLRLKWPSWQASIQKHINGKISHQEALIAIKTNHQKRFMWLIFIKNSLKMNKTTCITTPNRLPETPNRPATHPRHPK